MAPRFQLQLGDITSMDVEAIVNSTDESLQQGGPLHAAVHEAAGPRLMEACEVLPECPPGDARITGGFNLPVRRVIHTVAPTWIDGAHGELATLAACYRSALRLAEAQGMRSIAFPSIGSGVQPQIPLEAAAPVAVKTILDHLASSHMPERVVLVCFDAPTYQAHQRAMKETLP